LRACYDGAGGFDVGVGGGRGGGELFVEGEADGLDGDVGRAFAFEEGSVGSSCECGRAEKLDLYSLRCAVECDCVAVGCTGVLLLLLLLLLPGRKRIRQKVLTGECALVHSHHHRLRS